jgi:hypothetical protein
MIERGLTITGSDAELLSNALSELKTKAYEESDAQLDDTKHLVHSFRVTGVPRVMDMKNVTRILAPYVSAWYSARLSIGAKVIAVIIIL